MRPLFWKPSDFFRLYLRVFLLVSALVCTASAFFIYQYHRSIVQRTSSALTGVVDMKLAQVVRWRQERSALARQLAENPLTVRAIAALADDPSNQSLRIALKQWGESMQRSYDLEGFYLFDALMRPLIVSGSGDDDAGLYAEEMLGQALRARSLIFDDFHSHERTKGIELDLYVPLGLPGNARTEPVAGAILRSDPSRYLYPMLQTWPGESASAEVQLVKSDGAHVVFLNDLRHKKNAALAYSFDVTDEDMPEVKAVKGFEGVTSGRDYRGSPVIAAVRKVPGSPWFLIVKIDRAEIRHSTYSMAVSVALIDAMLLLMVGLFLWFNAKRHAVPRLPVAESVADMPGVQLKNASEENYQAIFNAVNDCIFIHDLRTGDIVDVNARTIEMWGYSAEELKHLGTNLLGSGEEPYTAERAKEWIKRAVLAGPQLFEWESKNKAGGKFWVEVSLRCTTINGHDRVLAVVRDIAERRKAEAGLRESEDRNRQLVELSPVGIVIHADGKILFANTAALRIFGADSLSRLQDTPVLERIHPDFRHIAAERIKATMQADAPVPLIEEKFLRLDGTAVDVEVISVPFLYQNRKAIQSVFSDVTERKKAIEEHRRSEERYRAIFESSRDVIYVLSPEGTFISLNPAIEAIGGWKPEEMLGQSFSRLVHPDDVSSAGEHFARTLQGDLQPPYEARFFKKNGDLCIGEVKASPLYQDGKVVGVQGTVSDITERRHSEDVIRRSRDHYLKLFDQIPHPMWVSDVSGIFVYFNQAWKALINISDSPTANADFIARIHPADVERCRAVVERSIEKREPFEDTCRILCDDGIYRWFSTYARPFDDVDGKFAGFIGTSYDITTLKVAQDELQRNYQLQAVLNQLLRISLNSNALSDLLGQVISVVAAINWLPLQDKGIFWIWDEERSAFSVVAERGFGPEINDLCARVPQKTCVCTRAIETGRIAIEDPSRGYVCNLHSGRHCCIPVKMSGKKIGLLHLFLRDEGMLNTIDESFLEMIADVVAGMVQRKQAEAEKEDYHARMIQSGKMAALGQMAAGVAHELNNPLTIIMGNSQYLNSVESCEEAVKPVLKEIESASQRCKKIVTDLLEFARKKEMIFHASSVNALVEEVLRMSASQEGFSALAVQTNFAADLPEIPVSYSHIEQVLLNIIINAVQAMPGGGALTVATRFAPCRRSVQIVVSDTGVGIPVDALARVFDPFYTTKTKGTGLGLAISYSIIRQHNGEITVTSAGPGTGTTVTLSLPVER